MTGPMNPGVEMWNGAAWVDISGDVQYADGITVTRGRQNEGGQSDPADCRFTLDNRTKNYSPRNPTGSYYGIFKRGTLVRAFTRTGESRQRNVGEDYFSCPDSAGISITGDIDLRSDLWLSTWRPDPIGVWLGLLKTGSYGVYVAGGGYIILQWWVGGVATWISSTVPVPGGQVGRKAIRVTLDVNNGAGGKTATFYYSSDNTMGGTWVQFDQVTSAGTTSIDDSTAVLRTIVDDAGAPAEVYEIRVYQGIGGTLRANPVFTSQASGTTSFADAQGNTWSNGTGGAVCDNRSERFYGRISDLRAGADQSGNYVYTKVVAAGATRRLGQGNAPTDSPLRSVLPTIGSALVGYWPLEDAKDATLPEAVVGGTARPRYIGPVKLASFSEFNAAKTAPVIGTGRIWLPVKAYANTDYFQVRCLMRLDQSIADQTVIMRVWTNSSLGWIDLVYNTGGSINFKTYTNLGVLSHTGTLFGISDFSGLNCVYSMQFKKNGTGVDLNHVIAYMGDDGFVQGSTNASITLGSCTGVYVNPNGADLKETAFSHLRVENVETSIFDFKQQNDAYRGELATTRFSRHCTEAGITPRVAGLGSNTSAMGYQSRSSRVSLLREAAELDGGIMFELGRAEALRLRTLESMCNQDAAFTFDFAAKYLQEFDPTDDDQRIRNRVVVSRTGGSSTTIEDTFGGDGALNNDGSPLSVYPPPDGVGLYDDSATLPLYSDEDTGHQAGWRVNLGTVDEPRIPSFAVDLSHPDLSGSPSNTRKILNLEIGDRIVIDNPPTNRLPPDDLDQIVQGIRERIDQFRHQITFNCGPSRPYRVAQQNGPTGSESRWGSLGSQLSAGVTSSATSLSVAYGSGPGWTHADGNFDIMVDGERMTVTNVTGSSSPQTFTVTRSVNGIVKAQSANAKVVLADQTVLGLTGVMGAEGQNLRAGDVRMPTPVSEYGNGINTITSTSFTYLPTTPLSVTISNPHPTRDMVCLLCLGGWGYISAGGSAFRVAAWVTRSNIGKIGPGPDSPLGVVGWGEVPVVSNTAVTQYQIAHTIKLAANPNPYVIHQLAYRDSASGTQTWEYGTLRVIPLYYV